MENYIFETHFVVRDYECDIQGIVNNSVYQNYMEHARHELLRKAGMNFKVLHDNEINPVVYRVEIDYKDSLKSGDEFVCKLYVKKEGNLKMIFYQDIFRKPDNLLTTKGKITAVVLKKGKPVSPDFFIEEMSK